jgi:hypothetical protein
MSECVNDVDQRYLYKVKLPIGKRFDLNDEEEEERGIYLNVSIAFNR